MIKSKLPLHFLVCLFIPFYSNGHAYQDSVQVRNSTKHDESLALAYLSGPFDVNESVYGTEDNEGLSDPSNSTQAPFSNYHQTAESVEQTSFGNKPAAKLLTSFDGLGFGFEGPTGNRQDIGIPLITHLRWVPIILFRL